MAGAGDYDRIHVIGVPLDHGAGRRGVGVGPSAIRIAGLHGILNRIGHQLVDHGDLIIAAPETQQQEHVNAKYLTLISRTCEQLCESVADVLDQGGFPLIIGGDHSMSIGSVSGIATHMHNQEPALDVRRLGVIWFDAHGDINTPDSSPSGNIHGMPVACLLGKGPKSLTEIGYAGPKVAPARFVQIGIRDIDDNERHLLADAGIHVYTMADIDRHGMAEIMERAIEIATKGTEYLHVSFDIDSVDPAVAPGTGTKALGGLTYREAHLAMEMIADTQRLTSLEVAEVNPILDIQNRTSEVAVELIGSALGKRIL